MDMNSPSDVQHFKEMMTYLTILAKGRGEGRVREAHRLLLRLATRRFGEPDVQTAGRLDAIRDIDHLEALADRLVDPELESWDELLAEAQAPGELVRGSRARS
jgi:hypothetical protein